MDGSFSDWVVAQHRGQAHWFQDLSDATDAGADVLGVSIVMGAESNTTFVRWLMRGPQDLDTYSYHGYFNTDNDVSTGYGWRGIEIWIDNLDVYKYTGDGGSWAWELLTVGTMSNGTDGDLHGAEYAFTTAEIPRGTIRFVLITVNVTDGSDVDRVPDFGEGHTISPAATPVCGDGLLHWAEECDGGTCCDECVPVALPAACDDGNACTQGDTCTEGGQCRGEPGICPATIEIDGDMADWAILEERGEASMFADATSDATRSHAEIISARVALPTAAAPNTLFLRFDFHADAPYDPTRIQYWIFVDADNDDATGYSWRGTDVLVMDDMVVYEYAGDGATWSWTSIGAATFAASSDASSLELSLTSSLVTRVDMAVAFFTKDKAGGTDLDLLPEIIFGRGVDVAVPADPVCMDGIKHWSEVCDNAAAGDDCCTDSCVYEASGTICFSSYDQCMQSSTCSGSSATCPDSFKSYGVTCTDGDGCSTDDICNGNGVCVGNRQYCAVPVVLDGRLLDWDALEGRDEASGVTEGFLDALTKTGEILSAAVLPPQPGANATYLKWKFASGSRIDKTRYSYTVRFDTDQDPSTGHHQLGDVMLEDNGAFYAHSGNPTDWNWAFLGVAQEFVSEDGLVWELKLEVSDPSVFSAIGMDVLFSVVSRSTFGEVDVIGPITARAIVPVCGDGVRHWSEKCDDIASPCCTPSCEFGNLGTPCLAGPSPCYMASSCSGDDMVCSPIYSPPLTPCNDGDGCAGDVCDGSGTCSPKTCPGECPFEAPEEGEVSSCSSKSVVGDTCDWTCGVGHLGIPRTRACSPDGWTGPTIRCEETIRIDNEFLDWDRMEAVGEAIVVEDGVGDTLYWDADVRRIVVVLPSQPGDTTYFRVDFANLAVFDVIKYSYRLYIDIDNDQNTGFVARTGAELMVADTGVYTYAGDGTTFAWNFTSLTQFAASADFLSYEIAVPHPAIPRGPITFYYDVEWRETFTLVEALPDTRVVVQPQGQVCGDGVVHWLEECDLAGATAGTCCSDECSFKPASHVCIPALNQCFEDSVCSGASEVCNVAYKSSGATCDDGRICTVGDVCDGGGGCFGSPDHCPASIVINGEFSDWDLLISRGEVTTMVDSQSDSEHDLRAEFSHAYVLLPQIGIDNSSYIRMRFASGSSFLPSVFVYTVLLNVDDDVSTGAGGWDVQISTGVMRIYNDVGAIWGPPVGIPWTWDISGRDAEAEIPPGIVPRARIRAHFQTTYKSNVLVIDTVPDFAVVPAAPVACGDGLLHWSELCDHSIGSSCCSSECLPCQPKCMDGLQNFLETDVDCGGSSCGKCSHGRTCHLNSDCQSTLGCSLGGHCRSRCLAEETIPNATRVCTSDAAIVVDGVQCQYTCLDGLRNATRECVDGAWTGAMLDCSPITCEDIEPVPHGTMVCNGTRLGNMCIFDCEEDYDANVSVPLARECTTDGWTGGALECAARTTCTPLNAPPNGHVTCTNTTCSFGCSDDFRVRGPNVRYCVDPTRDEVEEQWSGVGDTVCVYACVRPDIPDAILECPGSPRTSSTIECEVQCRGDLEPSIGSVSCSEESGWDLPTRRLCVPAAGNSVQVPPALKEEPVYKQTPFVAGVSFTGLLLACCLAACCVLLFTRQKKKKKDPYDSDDDFMEKGMDPGDIEFPLADSEFPAPQSFSSSEEEDKQKNKKKKEKKKKDKKKKKKKRKDEEETYSDDAPLPRYAPGPQARNEDSVLSYPIRGRGITGANQTVNDAIAKSLPEVKTTRRTLLPENWMAPGVLEASDATGAQMNRPTGNTGLAPIHWAAKDGVLSAVKSIANVGGDLSVVTQDKNAETALHIAARRGNTEMVTLLLRCGADPSVADKRGRTADVLAQLLEQEECARILQRAKSLQQTESEGRGAIVLPSTDWTSAPGTNDVSHEEESEGEGESEDEAEGEEEDEVEKDEEGWRGPHVDDVERVEVTTGVPEGISLDLHGLSHPKASKKPRSMLSPIRGGGSINGSEVEEEDDDGENGAYPPYSPPPYQKDEDDLEVILEDL